MNIYLTVQRVREEFVVGMAYNSQTQLQVIEKRIMKREYRNVSEKTQHTSTQEITIHIYPSGMETRRIFRIWDRSCHCPIKNKSSLKCEHSGNNDRFNDTVALM